MTAPDCSHKDRFPSELTARQIARQYQREYGDRNRVYYCDLCGGWHLTTTRNRSGQVEYTLALRRRWAMEEVEIDAI